ncbi:hypothetical protein [Nostoc sp.]|uniref:hypothetical protein n=1 Tax=Nostoc sp. TaxID=1180 RepID=UPI002FF9527C
MRGIDVEWDDHSARSLRLLTSEPETSSLQLSVTDTLRYLAPGVVEWEKLELEKRIQVPEVLSIGMSRMYLTSLPGLPPARRKLAAEEMVEAMCYSVRGAENFLDGVFQDLEQRKQQQPEWWSDRDRILIVVGSYDESEWVTSILQSRYPPP